LHLLALSHQPSKRTHAASQTGSRASHPNHQASLLRVPLPDQTRHTALLAITSILPCAEARRALVAAGAEAALQALLAGGPAAPQPAGAPPLPPPVPVAGMDVRIATWLDVEKAASRILDEIRQPPPGDAQPAAAADDAAPQCAVCGKRAAATPGGRPLMRCGGCRGPEHWCGKECQRAHWVEGHREVCRQRQAAAAAAAPSGT
jgi:hypothetical protein